MLVREDPRYTKLDLAAQEGHCYLAYKATFSRGDLRQAVAFSFHVKRLIPERSVVLDEVKVYLKAEGDDTAGLPLEYSPDIDLYERR